MWRMLLTVPLIINVVIIFNSLYYTRILTIQRVHLCHHVLFLCMNVRVCVFCCTVVWKTVWTKSAANVTYEWFPFRFKARWSVLSVGAHAAVQSSSPLCHDTKVLGLVMARPKTDEIWPISASSLAPDLSAAIFRPAGYKAAGTGALANPSALRRLLKYDTFT